MIPPGDSRRTAIVEIDPDLGVLRRQLKEVSKSLAREFDGILRKAAQPIIVDARRRYHRFWSRRTGRTPRAGMKAAVRGSSVVLIRGGNGVEYIHGQEWGSKTSQQFWRPGQPNLRGGHHTGNGLFFWPALQEGWDQAIEDMEEALDEGLENAANKIRSHRRR